MTAADDPYAYGHGTTSFHVEHYDLELGYRVRSNRLTGTAVLRLRTREELREIRLDLGSLAVHGVTVTGATAVRHRHRAGRLVIRLSDVVPADVVLGVEVRYSGAPVPVASPWGPVGWEELADGVVVASQPTGAPSWFPCNDRPADKATYRTSITVESPYRALAHGTLVARRARAGTTTWVYEERHPTATYLATVQVGRYEEISLAPGPVPQRVLVPSALGAVARGRLRRHSEMMTLFGDLFGPYPFAGYTLVVTEDVLEIPVEAQGMAVFGSNHLRTGGDGDRLVPHELAHQWFGNWVTVASWRHIWLNEGFACYAEWVWSEASGGPTADAHAARHRARLAQDRQDLVLADPGPGDIFDDRVYKRGALTLHALRRTLGDAAFWGLVRAWTSRHGGGSATTDDFRRLAAEHADLAGGEELAAHVDHVLTLWLDEPGLPHLPDVRPAGPTGLRGQLLRPLRADTPS